MSNRGPIPINKRSLRGRRAAGVARAGVVRVPNPLFSPRMSFGTVVGEFKPAHDNNGNRGHNQDDDNRRRLATFPNPMNAPSSIIVIRIGIRDAATNNPILPTYCDETCASVSGGGVGADGIPFIPRRFTRVPL